MTETHMSTFYDVETNPNAHRRTKGFLHLYH